MALDSAMLERVEADCPGPILLRFYRWEPWAVSLGYHQPITSLDQGECRNRGMTVVRRPTGGAAVVHQYELTYAVAASLKHPELARGLGAAYGIITEAVAEGLRRLGVPAELSRETRPVSGPGRGPASCFAETGSQEIILQGRKLVGSAQARTRTGLLQHGSILLDRRPELWRSVLGEGTGGPLEGSISLVEAGWSIAPEELARAVSRALGEKLGAQIIDGPLDPELERRAGEIQRSRQGDPCWAPEP